MNPENPTDREIIDGEHDCRDRLRSGHANFEDVHWNTNRQSMLEYECDQCGRTIWAISELINVQVQMRDNTEDGNRVMEPGSGDCFDAKLHPLGTLE